MIFLKKIKKSDFLFKSYFFYLSLIMIYIRMFHFLLGYCSYNYHNYVNNLAQQVCNLVSRQLVYGHFVYDTSSTDISSTDISSTMTFLAETEAGVMKRILYQ